VSKPKPQDQIPESGALILGGAHGSLEIARSLGRRGIPVWLVADDYPLAGLSRYVERGFSWPKSGDADAVAFLLKIADRHGLRGWVLFATSDEDVRFVAQNRAALETVFAVTTPAWDLVRWATDKRRMNALAAELGIARPLTYYPRGRDDIANMELRFPVILKPTMREGHNAFVDAKAWRADDLPGLLASYDHAASLVRPDCIMIQELIPGGGTRQFSYGAVWQNGTAIASIVARRRRQYPIAFGYTSTYVESIESREVEETASRFLRSLDYDGLVEIEFKYDQRDRTYKILDVNARAWTWIALGAASGVDFAAIQWLLAMGGRIAPISANAGATWRYWSRDLAAAIHEMLIGRLSPLAYLRTFKSRSASAVFAWDDPAPALLDLPLVAVRAARRRLVRRDRVAAPALQSVRSHS
jgi:D-aspartate ligase